MGLHLALGTSLCFQRGLTNSRWIETLSWEWLPTVGINFALALDGLSLLLALLTGRSGVARGNRTLAGCVYPRPMVEFIERAVAGLAS